MRLDLQEQNKELPYGDEGLSSERAIEKANKLGMDVVLPEDNQLQIDIDSDEAYARYQAAHILFNRYFSDTMEERPSKSGGEKRHITLTLAGDLTTVERILLQACLGSDPKRELLSYIRVRLNDPHPTLFVEKRQGLLGTGEELQMQCGSDSI